MLVYPSANEIQTDDDSDDPEFGGSCLPGHCR